MLMENLKEQEGPLRGQEDPFNQTWDTGELNNSTSDQISAETLDNLFGTLIQIFLTMKLGWLTGYFNIINAEQGKGLNIFVSKFSLPVLIFLSLAQLDFSKVQWSFILSIAITKAVVFAAVGVAELVVHRPRDVSRAAIFAILCTQTNDFGIGLPIATSVYGVDHPFVGFLYLVAPISLLFLNPIGFILLELEKNRKDGEDKKGFKNKLNTIFKVTKGLLLNPIILLTGLGIISNFIFQRNLPVSIAKFLDAIGRTFTSLAPFTLGLGMVGKMDNIRGNNLKPIFGLLIIKLLITPMLTHLVIGGTDRLFNGTSDPALANFGVLYGSLPPALGVDSYAKLYNLNSDLISSTIVVITIVSAPLVYLSSNILTVYHLQEDIFNKSLEIFIYNVSFLAITGTVLIMSIFLVSGRWRNMPHLLSFSLLVYSLEAGVGGLLWSLRSSFSVPWFHYVQAGLNFHGIYSARVSIVFLSLCLYLIVQKRTEYISRFQYLFLIGGPVIAGIITAVFVLTLPITCELEVQFGFSQDILNVVLDSLCLMLQVYLMAKRHRVEGEEEEKSLLTSCKLSCGKTEGEDSVYSPQLFRHSLLLMLYSGALFSNLALSVFRLANSSKSSYPGFYQVLVYIDSFLWTGQGLLLLGIFFLDCAYILVPVSRFIRWIVDWIRGSEHRLPAWIGHHSPSQEAGDTGNKDTPL